MKWIPGTWDALAAALLERHAHVLPADGPGNRDMIVAASREHLGTATPLVLCGVSAALLLLELVCVLRTGRRLHALPASRRERLLAGLEQRTALPLISDLLRLCRYLVVFAATAADSDRHVAT